MSPRASERRGFTFIEVLAVIGIVGILIAMLLPAVQSVREAARRMQCLNNLMQVVTALQHYQNVHEVLPSGVVNDRGPIANLPRGYHHGWLIPLLPYLERGNLARRFNNRVGLYASANLTVRSVSVALFLCPSDGGPYRRADGVALNNYAACHNDVEAPIGAKDNGAFFLNSRVGYEDIPDGTSHTIFVGEKKRYALDFGWASGTRATLRNAGISPNAPDLLYGKGPIVTWQDEDDVYPGVPAHPDPDNPNLVGGFSSHHPGGSNFAFGDGSVRFMSQSIGIIVLRRLANRADGEVIEDF
jgi:prepilin-type N-terminal cleavage/methylation domain-containing protein/prepilin-type processing-associated H-X9-DG protein